MSHKFIVMKSSRTHAGDRVSAGDAYTGPATKCAKVRAGHVYASLDAAKRAAIALNRCNPVGFSVVGIGWQERGGRWYDQRGALRSADPKFGRRR